MRVSAAASTGYGFTLGVVGEEIQFFPTAKGPLFGQFSALQFLMSFAR